MADCRPANCRFRLHEEGKSYPKSSCAACGRTIVTGLGTRCHRETDLIPRADANLAVAEAIRRAVDVGKVVGDGHYGDEVRAAIRALTPADAQAALDRMIAEAVAKAEAERDAARVGWVKLPEVPDPKWVSADDTRRFVVSFHDLQRAHLIAGLADIDHVDAMWMTICTDCERALATEAST